MRLLIYRPTTVMHNTSLRLLFRCDESFLPPDQDDVAAVAAYCFIHTYWRPIRIGWRPALKITKTIPCNNPNLIIYFPMPVIIIRILPSRLEGEESNSLAGQNVISSVSYPPLLQWLIWEYYSVRTERRRWMRRFLIIGGAVVFTFSVKWFLDANDQRMRRDYEQKKRRSKEESAQDVRFFARSLSDNVDL